MAQLNDLLVTGQSALLGPVKIGGSLEVSGSYSSPARVEGGAVKPDNANVLYYYGITDATPGTTQLQTGKLYFVYEEVEAT